MNNQKKIIVDLERMRYPYTGLYYYCLYLGKALQQEQDLHEAQLSFYLNKNTSNLFEKNSSDRVQHSFDKHHMQFAGNFNVWHCTFQGSNYFPSPKKTKIVLTIHDINFVHEELSPEKRNKFLRSLQKKIDKTNSIVFISEFVKNDVIKNFDTHNKSLHVIYNGCNIDDSVIPAAPAVISPNPFLFTISAIDKKKNFHVLPGLLIDNDYYLIIAGKTNDEAYRNTIIEAAKKLNVTERVIFTGAITEAEKYWYLKNCLLFVFPSIAEGFGLPVIEAMHFGKPVLLSKSTSLPEIGGEYAYYFDDFEPANMRSKLQFALADYDEKNPGLKITEWANKFSWKKAAQQHWQLYESLI